MTIISGGGFDTVSSGVTDSGTINDGGYQQVDSGGSAISGTVNSGGYQSVEGTTTGTVVNGGGQEDISSGGTASFTLLSGGSGGDALAYVYSGGVAISTTVAHGGFLWVEGGSTTGTSLNDAGVAYIGAGGVAVSTTVSGGSSGSAAARVYVQSGGTAISSTIDQGAAQWVDGGGTTTATVVSAGGEEDVNTGGSASGSTVDSGGTVVVNGGTTVGAQVNSGGNENVGSGGITSGTLLNGGNENVSSGGSDVSGTVQDGGTETVLAGGTASNIAIGSGGTVVLSAGAVVSGGIVFAGGSATLVIEGTDVPTIAISGLGASDTIALPDQSSDSSLNIVTGSVGQIEVGANPPVVTLAVAPSASNTATATLGSAAPGYDNDALSVALTSDADFASGSTLVLNNGTLVYTPGLITAAMTATPDTITYAVTDAVTGAVTTETQSVALSDGPAPVVTLAEAPSASNTATATLGSAAPGYDNDALSVALTSDADFASGVSTLVLNHGTLVYTPGLITAAMTATPDTITYSVTDAVTGAVTTETQSVALSDGPAPVVTLAQAPLASNTATATLGSAAPGLHNDELSVALTSDADFASGVSTLVLNHGTLVYTPGLITAAVTATPDTITYTVTDAVTGAVTTETQSVALSDGPAPVVTLAGSPSASNTATATLGSAAPGYDNDALSVALTSDADFASGSTLVLNNGTLVYTPGLITAAMTATPDTISYTVSDAVTGAVTTETQSVALSDGPDPVVTLAGSPSASNTATATLGSAAPGYDHDRLSVALTSDADFATGSTLVLNHGTLVYTPGLITAAVTATPDTISYTVTDAVTGAVTTETQSVALSDGPDPVVTLAEAPSASNTATATLGSAAPGYDHDRLAVTLTSDADFATGSTLVLNHGTLVYTPGLITAAMAATPDTISYTVTDAVTGAVTTETQTVALSDDPAPVVTLAGSPSASNIAPATLGTAVPGYDNDPLSVALTSDADFASGSTLVLNNGTLVYTPGLITAAMTATPDTLTYTVTDAVTGAVIDETQTVTLSNGPDPVVTLAATPFASDIASAKLGTAAPGLHNDPLSVVLTSDADFANGSTLVLNNGTLVYTPGLITDVTAHTDTLGYTVTDTVTGAVTTETQTVALGAPELTPDILLQDQSGQLTQWSVSGLSITSSTLIGSNPGSSWLAMGTGAFYSGDSADIVWQNVDGAVALWRVQGTTLLGGAIVADNPGTSWHIKGTGNFYQDGDTDILWQNDDGSVAIWDMQGASIVQGAVVAANPGTSWHIVGTGDFYGDGNTDILWQNDDGSVAIWDMQGASIVQGAVVAANPGTSWHIVGTGDFYGDGNTDIVWQNSNGSVAIWDMQGATIVNGGIVANNPGPTWHIESVGDFNSNGSADIVWQNDNGSVAVWQMDGTSVVQGAVVASNPDSTWQVEGTGDLYDNGNTDILGQNGDGSVALLSEMSGTSVVLSEVVAGNPGTSWHIVGTGNFYGDGNTDILWQNDSGEVALWDMAGSTISQGAVVASNPGTSWHIKGTGDFYGDGNTDILWQNDNGSVALWDMQGASIVQGAVLAADPGPSWHIEGTGNFYGDGNTDILWQNDDGSVAIWDMSGTSIVQGAFVASNPGSTWHIKGTGDFYGDGNTDILWQNDNGSVAIWDMQGSTIAGGGIVANNPGPTWHIEGVGAFNDGSKADIVWQNDNGSVAIWGMDGTNIVSGAVLANPSSTALGGDQNMRFVYSSSAGETLSATPQAPDEFVFTSFAEGAHAIAGFDTTQDVIELNGAQFGSFADVQAATSATASGALIHLDNSSSLLLEGVNTGSLHASNFALT